MTTIVSQSHRVKRDIWDGFVDGVTSQTGHRSNRFRREFRQAAVVIVLLLFVGGIFVARSLIPSRDSQQGAIGQTSKTGEIAFASDQSGVFQIYTVNADGSGLRQLTHSDKPDLDPVWSPDGRRIAYTQAEYTIPPGVPIPPGASPLMSVYIMNADGSNARDLTPTPAKVSFRTLSWSPDSKHLAVDCPLNGNDIGSNQICVLNVDEPGMRRIGPPGILMSSPSWSPNGRWIAAIGSESTFTPYELYLLSPDGNDSHRLSNDVASPLGFAWSPDGSRIAIVQGRPAGSTNYGKITVVNIDGSGQHDLNVGDVFSNDLAWSPDGSRILFRAAISGTAQAGVDVVNADGTGLREIVPKEVGVISVSWSQDGQAVAYTRNTRDETSATPGGNYYTGMELDVVRLDGSAPRTIFSQRVDVDQYGLDGSPPAWRPVVSERPQPTPTAVATASPAGLPGIAPWPAATADPDGLSLALSKTTVKPGDVITRTIAGADRHPDVITSDTLFLEKQIDGQWRWIYFLDLAPPSGTPGNYVPGPDTAISAVGLLPQPFIFQIPNVPPGTYRLRQDATYGSDTGPATQVTLYATITVVQEQR